MVRRARRRLCIGLSCLPWGCAQTGGADRHAEGPVLSGRMAVRMAPKSASRQGGVQAFSARFELSGDAQQGRLQLFSPLGTTVADAVWNSAGVVLRSGEQLQVFESLDELSTQVLGQPIPLVALWDWSQGRPWPGAPSERAAAADGFSQLGWHVGTAELTDHGLLQAWHDDERGTMSLRVRLDR